MRCNLLATALGGGMSSRLFTEVRERRGLAYYVYGFNQGYTDAGTLYAQGGVDIKRIDEAIHDDRRASSSASPTSRSSRTSSRRRSNFAKGRLVLSLEDPKGTIMFGLRGEVLEGRAREPDEVLAGFDGVTVEDVQRVAQDVIAGDRLRLAVIGPFDDAARFEELLAVRRPSGAPGHDGADHSSRRHIGEGVLLVVEPDRPGDHRGEVDADRGAPARQTGNVVGREQSPPWETAAVSGGDAADLNAATTAPNRRGEACRARACKKTIA